MQYQTPRGTRDIFGQAAAQWRSLENEIHRLCADFSFMEIRTPIFEHTSLFTRSSGETSDVVQKEMYTFEDRGGRSVSLRPEMTAGAARAFVEHGMHAGAQPTKLYYIGPNFRYDKPAAGRFRQHHQFGVEHFGSYSPAADAEVISIAYALLNTLGIKDFTICVNSLGGIECRERYNGILKEFIREHIHDLCGTCAGRAEKNPLRILDCKEKKCQAILAGAPAPPDSLGEECSAHFMELMAFLAAMKIPYVIEKKLVRGLDYYTRTVFEFIDNESGLSICGGGRYDSLIQDCGGPELGGVGFGMGLERLVLILERGEAIHTASPATIFLGSVGRLGFEESMALTFELRKAGIRAECDTLGRSVKAQMKHADKIGAIYSAVLGDNEVEEGRFNIKEMATGEQSECALTVSNIVSFLAK